MNLNIADALTDYTYGQLRFRLDVCILSDRMSQIRFALFVGSDFFDSIGRPPNVEYSTSEVRS